MHQSTSNFAIQYPCGYETVTCDDFANFATSSDAALSTVWNNATAAIRPPVVKAVNDHSPQTINAGVTATATFDTEVYDTAGFYSLATPTIFTIPVDGSYLITYKTVRGGLPTTLTSFRQAILLAGAEVAYCKDQYVNAETASTQSIVHMIPSVTAGQQITGTMLFTGTGSMLVYAMISICLISTT